MKIVQLTAENVKRLSAVSITPPGAAVVIGGRNGQGKSSVLDSIMYALSGAASLPGKPIRNGCDKGQVTVDLGDMVVTRKFSVKDGVPTSSLEIKNKDGFKASSPQKILDDLCGKMAFDPLEFSRLKPKDQLDALRELVGLDFTELDRKRATAFEKRTDVNRTLKAKNAELIACPAVEAPSEEVSVAALVEELQRRNSINTGNANSRKGLTDKENDHKLLHEAVVKADQLVIELEEKLSAAKVAAKAALIEATESGERLAEIRRHVSAIIDEDIESVQQEIKNAEGVNNKVRQNAKRNELQQVIDDLEGDAEELTKQLDSIDKQKAEAMAKAPFPVPGLGFDAAGVTFNGLPFSQASSAEQLRVSVAMGLALNPKLRVMLIRDGSLLDSESLALVSQMAEEADAQIWIERVSTGEEVSVVIEDGQVKAAELAEVAT